jgi:hypothetical protein
MHENDTTVTIMGAGGKMGTRILNNLVNSSHRLLLCEKSEPGRAAIRNKGLSVTPMEEAVPRSDVLIMAVPDAVLGAVSREVVPRMKSGSLFILLDPAAAYAGEVALREDCTFMVTHPCHPALFEEQESPEARADMFGGVAAKQDIVVALIQGEEGQYERGIDICTRMFAPVIHAHRITVAHMALLEPAMAEVVGAACGVKLKEAMEEVIRRGVPEGAARAFMLGHIRIVLAILFKSSNPFSDAAVRALHYGSRKLFRDDWKQVFEQEAIKEVLQEMLHPDAG